MWSKRPKPGGKGPRCKIGLKVGQTLTFCERPARLYKMSKSGHPLGEVEVCKGHVQMYERMGATLQVIDRRRKRLPGSSTSDS